MATRVVSKVFWPLQATDMESGFLVGWNIRRFTVCVATVVSDVNVNFEYGQLDSLEASLHSLMENSALSKILAECQGPPMVLGEWTGKSGRDVMAGRIVQAANIWVRLCYSRDQQAPCLRHIYCCGSSYRTSSQIIFYDPPRLDRYHYYCMKPLSVDEIPTWSERLTDMDYILHQINASAIVSREISRLTFRPSTGHEDLDTATTSCAQQRKGKMITFLCVLSYPFLFVLFAMRLLSATFPLLLDRLVSFLSLMGIRKIRDVSATVQQVEFRLREICVLPVKWADHSQNTWKNSAAACSHCLSFWNSFLQIVIDILLGVSIGILLLYYPHWFVQHYGAMDRVHTTEVLHTWIVWLMGSPAGFKLNLALDQFLGFTFLMGIDMWGALMVLLRPFERVMYHIVACSGLFGVTIQISLVYDIISLLSLHIFILYNVSAYIYNVHLNAIFSLFRLFRGKKYNVLRNRVDSCDYSFDQLLLGTILFTMLLFLFTTIWVYYVFFTMIRLLSLAVQWVISSLLAYWNHFPFMAFLLHYTDPGRLPRGIMFEVSEPFNPVSKQELTGEDEPSSSGSHGHAHRQHHSTTYLILRNRTTPLSSLFLRYKSPFVSLVRENSLGYILHCLFLGHPLPMARCELPWPELPSVSASWELLRKELGKKATT